MRLHKQTLQDLGVGYETSLLSDIASAWTSNEEMAI